MPYTRAWDEAAPLGSVVAKNIDDEIRNFKTDIRERIAGIFGLSAAQFAADPVAPISLTTSGAITAGSFVGPLTGNVIGNVTGSSGSTTGNAATATALQNSRTIFGQSFDGTANVTGGLTATSVALSAATDQILFGGSSLGRVRYITASNVMEVITNGGVAATFSAAGALTVASTLTANAGTFGDTVRVNAGEFLVLAGGADPGGGQTVRIAGTARITGLITLGNGLIVSAGTTAVQALTATSGTFSSTLRSDSGQVLAAFASVINGLSADGSQGYVGPTSNHPLVLRTNNLARISITATGVVTFGSAISTGASAGDLVIPRINTIYAVDFAGTGLTPLISAGATAANAVTLGSTTPVAIGTPSTLVTGAAAGELVLANTKWIRGVNAAATNTLGMIRIDGANQTEINANSVRLSIANPDLQNTVGAAGGAAALPANPINYLKVYIGGGNYVIPFYLP